jgi:hypothetical protein
MTSRVSGSADPTIEPAERDDEEDDMERRYYVFVIASITTKTHMLVSCFHSSQTKTRRRERRGSPVISSRSRSEAPVAVVC